MFTGIQKNDNESSSYLNIKDDEDISMTDDPN